MSSNEDFSSLEVRLCPAELLLQVRVYYSRASLRPNRKCTFAKRRESPSQGSCGTGSGHFANLSG